MPARKSDKTSKPAVRKPIKRAAALGKAATTLPESMVTGKASPVKAAVGDKPVFAYIASLPQPQRGMHRCSSSQDASRPAALREMGHVVLWRRRWLVLLLRRLRRPRQAHVRERCGTRACTACDAGGDGQVYAGRGARISGRPRRTPDRGVDETSRGRARSRGEEAVGPRGGVGREGVSRRVAPAWRGGGRTRRCR